MKNLFLKSNYSKLIASQFTCKIHTLHKNILPTYHFQNCLPRLPIPKLQDSIEKYLRSLQALEGHPDCLKVS